MSYEFSCTLKAGFLHCVARGKNVPENVARFMMDVSDACKQHECGYVLMEDRLRGPGLKLTDIYRVVSEGSVQSFPHIKRIAYVDSNPEHSEANNRFAETVARNRGVQGKFFSNIQDAETWLIDLL